MTLNYYKNQRIQYFQANFCYQSLHHLAATIVLFYLSIINFTTNDCHAQ
jgi:hypothetical protein